MTVKNYIKHLVYDQQISLEEDSIEKLIYMAYYIGKEEASRNVSNKYNEVLAAQIQRASQERYYKMAMRVQGNIEYVYNSDYSMTMTSMFGDDETKINVKGAM